VERGDCKGTTAAAQATQQSQKQKAATVFRRFVSLLLISGQEKRKRAPKCRKARPARGNDSTELYTTLNFGLARQRSRQILQRAFHLGFGMAR